MEAEITYCKTFYAKVVKISHSSKTLVPEEVTEKNDLITSHSCILVKVQCEGLEDLKYVYLLVNDILERCSRSQSRKVVLCPYGHLSNKRGPKEVLLEIFNFCEAVLKTQGIQVKRVHFGSQKDYGYEVLESVIPTSRRSYPYNKHFYTAKSYVKLVTHNPNPFFQKYQHDEANTICEMARNYQAIIDIGSGYGRSYEIMKNVLEERTYIGIENNKDMYLSGVRKVLNQPRHQVIFCDALKLQSLFPDQRHTLLLCLQNTLGVLQGSTEKFMQMLGLMLREKTNNACISFLKKSSLAQEGVSFYESIRSITGDINYHNSELEDGIIRMNNGYSSRWYSIDEARTLFSRHFTRKVVVNEHEHHFFIQFA